MLALFVFATEGPPPIAHLSLKTWLALLASGFLCTATTNLSWNWGISRVPASQAAVLINIEPLMGSVLGVFVLGESLGPTALAGAALILAGAFALTTHSKTTVNIPAPE